MIINYIRNNRSLADLANRLCRYASTPSSTCVIQRTQRRMNHGLRDAFFIPSAGFCSDSMRGLKEKGDIYSQTTGVELKYDDDEDGIDWETSVDFSNITELVKRCMSKYPSVVPTEISIKKAKLLLMKLPGFVNSAVGDEAYQEFLVVWSQAYQKNLEEIMFKNLASYEP